MLVLKRKVQESITINRPWAPPETAPEGKAVLILCVGMRVAVIGRRHGEFWTNFDGFLINSVEVVGWQPIPGVVGDAITVKVCEVMSGHRVQLGIEAPPHYSLLRSELV